MRSKRQERSGDEARRAQLVRCMIDAIAELGMRGASLSEVARRAAITKGAIFYHFTNRGELLEAVVDEVTRAGAAFVAERVAAAATPTAALRAYVQAFTAAMREAPRDIAVLIAVGSDRDYRPADPALTEPVLTERALAPVEDILRRGQASGEFLDFPVRSVAMTVRAATEAVPAQLAANPGLDLDAHGRALADLFERAVTGTVGGRG